MREANRLSLRFLFIGLVALGLLIPLLFVDGVADERQRYYGEVVSDIGQSWGHQQALVGPLLVIPAVDAHTFMDDNGKPRQRLVEVSHVVLPEVLNADTHITHDFRQRGIYSVPVYTAKVSVQGRLGVLERAAIADAHRQVHWDQAKLVLGISDTRAIRRATGQLDGQTLNLEPGTSVNWMGSGVHSPIDLSLVPLSAGADTAAPEAAGTFNIGLELAGTNSFAIAPLGNQTELTMQSSWPHPSFTGNFLPQERSIDADGFSARWSVSALARGVPKQFVHTDHAGILQNLTAAVGLYEPVTSYTTVDRGIKYGLLFIGLTFLTAVCFELLSGIRFHLIQYGVVGLALALFYLTLLSLTEQMTFGLAYGLATLVILLMLGAYAWSITRTATIAAAFVAVEALLYWVLYVLLQLEDLALLTGSGLLLVGLGVLMLATQGLHKDEPGAAT